MNEVLAKRFKDLCQGRGQPDERDFAAALLELDARLEAVESRLGKRQSKVPVGAGDTQTP